MAGTYTTLLNLKQLPPNKEVPVGEVAKSPNSHIATRRNSPIAQSPSGEVAKSPERRSPDRRIVRQGFDLYEDQLLSLSEIQMALYQRDKHKPTMREIMLSAVDSYVKKMKSQLGLE